MFLECNECLENGHDHSIKYMPKLEFILINLVKQI